MEHSEPTAEELDRLFAWALAEYGGRSGTQRYAESARVLAALRELRKREPVMPRGYRKRLAAALDVAPERISGLVKLLGMARSQGLYGEYVSCAYCFKLFWMTTHQLSTARGNIQQGTTHADWMPTCSPSCAIRRAKSLRGQNGRVR